MSILEPHNHQSAHSESQLHHWYLQDQAQEPQPQTMYSSLSPFNSNTPFTTQNSSPLLVQLSEMASHQQALGINIVALEETMKMVLTSVTRLSAECHDREIIHIQQIQQLRETVQTLVAQPVQTTRKDQTSREPTTHESAGPNPFTIASNSARSVPQTASTTPREPIFVNRTPSLLSALPPLVSRGGQEFTTPRNIAQDILQTSVVPHESTGACQIPNFNYLPSRATKKRRRRDSAKRPLGLNKKAGPIGLSTGNGESLSVSTALSGSAPLFDWSTIPILEDQMEELVSCDKCDRSFHYGCVNITTNDPVLKEDIWWCPPCRFESAQDISTNQPARNGSESGCRVDCPVKDDPEARYAVESIIGRSPYLENSTVVQMQYLIKWEGYPADRSSWTLKNEMSTGTHILIAAFEKAAAAEGLNLSNHTKTVLLQEAIAAGWGCDNSLL